MSKIEFFTTRTVRDVLSESFSYLAPPHKQEIISTYEALGRVVAVPPISPINLPEFVRSTMDGYAVRAEDTYGATSSLPAYLRLTFPVKMGEQPQHTIGTGEASEIHTGAMLPDGANAVVMVEQTQIISDTEIEILKSAAPGENVIQVGEDISTDTEILPAGHRMRPQDIGGLLAVGIETVTVCTKPLVAIMGSGDELIHPAQTPHYGQIRDINSYTLKALFEEAGAEVRLLGIAQDNLENIQQIADQGIKEAEMLVISAGSSVSTRDYTHTVISQLGKPGILQHGLAVKPGKPTIIAVCDGKPVIGLPGNPVSAFLVARQIIIPIIYHLLGMQNSLQGTIQAILKRNIASITGREDTIPVRLSQSDGEIYAEPVIGKSNLIYTLVNAQGVIEIPLNSNGIKAGTRIDVTLI